MRRSFLVFYGIIALVFVITLASSCTTEVHPEATIIQIEESGAVVGYSFYHFEYKLVADGALRIYHGHVHAPSGKWKMGDKFKNLIK